MEHLKFSQFNKCLGRKSIKGFKFSSEHIEKESYPWMANAGIESDYKQSSLETSIYAPSKTPEKDKTVNLRSRIQDSKIYQVPPKQAIPSHERLK